MSGLSRIRQTAARADKNKSVVDQGSVSPAQREDGPRHTAPTTAFIPTYKQNKVLDLLAQLDPVLKQKQVARASGVPARTIRAWQRIPGWYIELDKRQKANESQLRVIAKRTLSHAMNGFWGAPAISAARTALQITGDLSGDGVHVHTHQETNIAVGSAADRINKRRLERGLAPLSQN